ncbi:MAG: hypothetical protein JSR77_10155 [Planctomycetes bacterium]|nr:hypothetical protein [Planctomycetota bacterium]
MLHRILIALLLIAAPTFAQEAPPAAAPSTPGAKTQGPKSDSFRIVFDADKISRPYSGRVYVAFSSRPSGEPRRGMQDWFNPGQVLSLDVTGIEPGGHVDISAATPHLLAFPKQPAEIPSGNCRVQAVARVNPDSPKPGMGAGDLYSEAVEIDFAPGGTGPTELHLTKVVGQKSPKDNDQVRYFEMVSPKLSQFAGRTVTVKAGVFLPKDWKDDAAASYPTLWFIGGFGSDHTTIAYLGMALATIPGGENVMIVCPDPTCYRGHSVFADSANNGPWGAMLTQELIPAVEQKFHGAQSSANRFVSGMSSGGWSSLWLQITYPDQFARCWSFCPDPVDFRDFQKIDLYAPGENMYRDGKGERRGLARGRTGDDISIYYDTFVAQETALGPGGQIHSFEAVFSPRGDNNEPVPLFDRASGAIDPKVAKAWEAYDIRLVLERNWATLGPKLAGKINIIAGGRDTFYLEGAVKLLSESLTKLGSDAKVTIVPGMPHQMHSPSMQEMMGAIGAAK